MRAVQEGKSMKELIVEGISLVLGRSRSVRNRGSAKDLLLQFSGKAAAKVTDGSVRHDDYLYDT